MGGGEAGALNEEDPEIAEEFDPWALPELQDLGPKWSGEIASIFPSFAMSCFFGEFPALIFELNHYFTLRANRTRWLWKGEARSSGDPQDHSSSWFLVPVHLFVGFPKQCLPIAGRKNRW